MPCEEGGRDWIWVLSFSYLTDKKTETQRGREEVEVEANFGSWPGLLISTLGYQTWGAIQCPSLALSSSQLIFIETLPSPAAPWEPGQARNNYNASKEQWPASALHQGLCTMHVHGLAHCFYRTCSSIKQWLLLLSYYFTDGKTEASNADLFGQRL